MNRFEFEKSTIAIVPLAGKGYLISLPDNSPDRGWGLFDSGRDMPAPVREPLVLVRVNNLIYCESLADVGAILVGVYGEEPGGTDAAARASVTEKKQSKP